MMKYYISQAHDYDNKPTIKELANNIFGEETLSLSETKPIEKKNIGESLDTFEKRKEKKSHK